MKSVSRISGLGINTAMLLALASSTALASSARQPQTGNSADSPDLTAVRSRPSADVENVDDSTVVYPAVFFEPYSPVSANDMLDRIPGVSVGGGGGGRGLGTGGDLLINGQRIAGKDNSPRDQLSRIAASEVMRIEIIRGTSGDLAVRGAGQVVNIVLTDADSRASTSTELVARLNHDDVFEVGAEVSHSRQIGNFQALVSLQARPNYENRQSRETQFNAGGQPIGSLFEANIRDQDEMELTSNMSYRTGPHRMQFNALYGDSGYPRRIRRDFLENRGDERVARAEEEEIDNDHFNWEVGGDYEYTFANDHRLQFLFIANDQTRDNVRERFNVAADSVATNAQRDKTLFIESNQRTRERIVQGNYNFPVALTQDLRVGLERADTQLDSSLFIGSSAGTEPASERYGGLSPLPDISNPGTAVQEIRYEGFVFHNWTLNDRMTLESSVVYEASEIAQSGTVNNSRRFTFVRPAVDYRFNLTDSFQIRAAVERDISQLSFANFAATANNSDREQDADAGNPELEPEQAMRYELGFEYRLPNDNGVLSTRFFFRDIEDYIGRINATKDPAQPISAVGNVGDAKRWGVFTDFSTRLSYFDLPDAIVSGELNIFDSSITDPFLGTEQRINRRGEASLEFRQDITEYALNYGIEYNYPFHGGEYDIDITTVTRNDNDPSLDMFVSKVFFDDITVRLESDNTLGQSRCRERRRYDGTTIDGRIREIEDSCSSRYRRLTLRVQTTF